MIREAAPHGSILDVLEIGPGRFGPRCGGEAVSADCRCAPNPPYGPHSLILLSDKGCRTIPFGRDVFLYRSFAGVEARSAGVTDCALQCAA